MNVCICNSLGGFSVFFFCVPFTSGRVSGFFFFTSTWVASKYIASPEKRGTFEK